ncbi:MAG: phosphoribosylformylglycinamidine cyclo-ligase, partial [Novosphingobium sp.]
DLAEAGETVFRIGEIVSGEKGCTVTGSVDTWSAREPWEAVHLG